MDIGKEYQEKIIQYPIRIPSMNKYETEFYILCLLAENELEEQKFNGLLSYLQEKTEDIIREKIVDFKEKIKEFVSKDFGGAAPETLLIGDPKHAGRGTEGCVGAD